MGREQTETNRYTAVGPKKRIIIELTPTAIDGAVILWCGRVVRTARVALEPTDWRQAWEEGLSQFDSKLATLVAQLDAAGARVDAAYRSPSSFADVITVPVTGSVVHSAAKLALADHVAFDLQMNPHCINPITATKTKHAKATHTIAVADDSQVSQTLSAWIERAGCHLVSAMPAGAMMLGDAIEEARRDRDESVSTRLYVDRHSALMIIVSGGRIRMVRRIEIGFEDFVTAITRPIIRHDLHEEGDELITLTPAVARAILCKSGIPGSGAVVDAELGLKGKDILPLIQPALQRMAIEIKQSLRFELSKEERESIQLTLSGPYGSMPNLASAICDQIEISHDNTGAGTLELSTIEAPFLGDPGRAKRLAHRTRSNSLVSDQIIASLRLESFRVGIRAGAVAAALALLVTAFVTNAQIRSARHSTQNLGGAIATVDEIIEINESITNRSAALTATQRRMGAAIGMTTRWSGVMAALPGLVAQTVTLSEIEGVERTERESPRIELTGVARDQHGQTCQEALNVFIESLNSCPLVQSVDLGVTNRIRNDAELESMRFSITVNLVVTPRLAAANDEVSAAP